MERREGRGRTPYTSVALPSRSRMVLIWEPITGSLVCMIVPVPCILPLRWCKASCPDCLGGAQPVFVGMPMRQQVSD